MHVRYGRGEAKRYLKRQVPMEPHITTHEIEDFAEHVVRLIPVFARIAYTPELLCAAAEWLVSHHNHPFFIKRLRKEMETYDKISKKRLRHLAFADQVKPRRK